MIDNRLVEDVQTRLKPDHFFEPLHGRIYEAILRLTDRNMIANPVTLRPLFEADEGIKEVGGPAYLAQLTGSGAAVIGARDFAAQIYDLALLRALIAVGRDLVESALDTSEEVAPIAQIERAETELYKVAEEGGAEGKAKSFGEATKLAIEMAERALNSGGHLSGLRPGDGLTAKSAASQVRPKSSPAAPAWRKSALRPIRFWRGPACAARTRGWLSPARAPARASRCSSLEMSADSWPPDSREPSGISSENRAWSNRRRVRHRPRRGQLQTLPRTSTTRRADHRAPAREPAPQAAEHIGIVIVDL